MNYCQNSGLVGFGCINYFYNLGGILCEVTMTENITFSAILWKEGKLQIAWSPELDIASQGKNVEEAIGNLREAIELYLEDEDAKIPTSKSPILTTLSVETHAKAETCFRS
jgi:predicted RNase H-like HicB family nuclease